MSDALRFFCRAFVGATLVLCAAAAALTVSMHARDSAAQLRLEFLGGRCQQDAVGDGIWYHSAFPHTLDTTSTCYAAGASAITATHGPWAFGVRMHYVDLGKITAAGVYPMNDHEFAAPPSGRHCDPRTFTGCLGEGTGTQQAYGVSLGALVERGVGAGITLGAEAGAYVYHGTWAITVQPHGASQFPPVQVHWKGLEVTPYLGLTAQWGYLMAMGRVYTRIWANEHNCGHCTGFAYGPAYQLLAGVSIPL